MTSTPGALSVADPWFEVEEVGDGVTRIGEPHVSDLVSANLWWIRGDRHDVVVDTGLGVASLRRHLPAVFAHDPLAVVTHTHLDHVGGAHEFEQVAVHGAEATVVRAPAAASLDPVTELDLLGLEVPPGAALPPSLLKALPEQGYESASYAVRPAAVTRVVADGDVIDLGDRRLRVLHLPGHSPGSIVVLDEGARLLFSGDVVYDDTLLDELDGAHVPSYVASMRRLLDLEVARVHPGHGESFGQDRLREIASEYVARRAGS